MSTVQWDSSFSGGSSSSSRDEDIKILGELFEDKDLCQKIQRKLPYLFQIAENYARRGGKIGMEIGTFREQIITALLIYKFGETNVNVHVPINEPDADVYVRDIPLSIKTITASNRRKDALAVKISWTVDAIKAHEFQDKYKPSCGIILAVIRWGKEGGLYGIPYRVQVETLHEIGPEHYLSLPKAGTNPRGIEISSQAMEKLLSHTDTYCLPIEWKRSSEIEETPYRLWLEYWRSE